MDRAGPPWGQCASAQEAVSQGLEQHPMGPSVGAGGQHLGLGVDQKATQGLKALPALRRTQRGVEDRAPG